MVESEKNGSELHRLRPMQEGYDKNLFNELYKVCQPIIRNLVRQIDCRRFNVSPDIIKSQFDDKLLFVFNKYYGVVNNDQLKYTMIRALTTYKLHLLKYAYTDKAEFNQHQLSLDTLFDNDKELLDDSEEYEFKENLLERVDDYMEKNLSPDAYLVWEALNRQPPYIRERLQGSRVTNRLLAEFFNLPKSRNSIKYISTLRLEINHWMVKASTDIKL